MAAAGVWRSRSRRRDFFLFFRFGFFFSVDVGRRKIRKNFKKKNLPPFHCFFFISLPCPNNCSIIYTRFKNRIISNSIEMSLGEAGTSPSSLVRSDSFFVFGREDKILPLIIFLFG